MPENSDFATAAVERALAAVERALESVKHKAAAVVEGMREQFKVYVACVCACVCVRVCACV